MSTLKADTIVASDGSSPVTLTKQSAAKGWINFNGTGTIAARDSFNNSSLTDSGTGRYKTTHTNSYANASYSFYMVGGNPSDDGTRIPLRMYDAQTTSTFGDQSIGATNSTNFDTEYVSLAFHGDLA
jgi:hypothetical protein